MENQALFSSKDKSKKLKCRLLQILFDALRINIKKKAESAVHKEMIINNNFNYLLLFS